MNTSNQLSKFAASGKRDLFLFHLPDIYLQDLHLIEMRQREQSNRE